MTAEEWAEWEAGENERARDLFERVKRMHAEREGREKAEQQPPARRRRFFLFR
jgi:hypothetical protein